MFHKPSSKYFIKYQEMQSVFSFAKRDTHTYTKLLRDEKFNLYYDSTTKIKAPIFTLK